MIIAKIGQILNTPIGTKQGKTVNHSSNPFASTSFKGNVLTADVFETKATPKNKLTMSAFVGSIGDAFPTFRKGIESVIAFGNRIKEGTTATINKIAEIGNTEISIDFAGAGRAFKDTFTSLVDGYSVQKLKKQDVSTLEALWKESTGLNIAG